MGIEWGEAMDAAVYHTVYRTDPPTKTTQPSVSAVLRLRNSVTGFTQSLGRTPVSSNSLIKNSLA